MSKMIHEILHDLYEVDPTLKKKEKELKKIIEKLISSKPSVMMDEEFKKTLKKKLLQQFKKETHSAFEWFFRNKMRIIISTAAALFCAVIGFAVFIPLWQATKSDETSIAYTPTEEHEVYSGEAEPAFSYQGKPEPQDDKVRDRSSKEKGEMVKDIPEETTIKEEVTEPEEPKYAVTEKKKEEVVTTEKKEIHGFLSLGMLESGRGGGGDDGIDSMYIEQDEEMTEGAGIIFTGSEEDWNTEEYDRIYENRFLKAIDNPLSTFSIDVDTASYANVRRFIANGRLPYPDAVRIEELINYFSYDYPQPGGEHPFAFFTEISVCPWNTEHRLIHIGIQGKQIPKEQLPPNNLVFLIDVSGSMNSPNKLPLLKKAFTLLADELRQEDRVAIVVYAGAAGMVLPSTSGADKEVIIQALEGLSAGGSTAGGQGIVSAYETAQKYYNPQGNNRVILATDGDFNVGPSSDAELVRLIEEKRNRGIFLTVLGFGMGNYKDSKMEKLADKGNGNYAYIDTLSEAKKVLINEMGSTLLTIAKDVKIQIEFNPAHVNSYRLIGYENRVLAKEDFDDDTKDAGELGAGHTVTALYEVVPFQGDDSKETLKYQETTISDDAYATAEIMTMKFRYKKPKADDSILIEIPVEDTDVSLDATSDNFRFSAAVAEWGLLLRKSEYKGNGTYTQVLDLARGSCGRDEYGYRSEFISLVESVIMLNRQQ
jgi:Ca-activated chloride channel family protein